MSKKRHDPVRSFVRNKKSGAIGVIMCNDLGGGVYRGHMDCWFGHILEDGTPLVLQVLTDNYEPVECPLGITEQEFSRVGHTGTHTNLDAVARLP